jgi:hypothetical protein
MSERVHQRYNFLHLPLALPHLPPLPILTSIQLTSQLVNDDQVILRFCSPWDGYCCQNSSSTADCCAAGVGFEWNNATWINYQFAPQQNDFGFNLASAYTTTSASTTATQVASVSSSSTKSSASTAVTSATTASACSNEESTNGATCSNSSTVAIGAGLGVGLGVPLLLALAGLLWLTARRRYEQPRTTVLETSGSSKPEPHGYRSGPAPAYNGGYSEGRDGLPIGAGYGRAELDEGERRRAELGQGERS